MFIFFLLCILTIITIIFINRYFRNNELHDPKNKAIFISGCDTGIGRFLAIYLDTQGFVVFAGCLDPIKAKTWLGGDIKIIPLNVTSMNSITDAVATIKEEMENQNLELWCLINNAGVLCYGEFDWLTMDQCEQQVEVNLLGTIRLTKVCLSLLRKSHGRIINIASINGVLAYPGMSVYCATKFGLEGFSDSLRVELAFYDVKVIVIQLADLAKATSIMENHEQKAQIMWNAMSKEDQDYYRDYFKHYQEVVKKNVGITSFKTIEESPLLFNINHAVLSKNPNIRYLSTTRVSRLIYKILLALPDSCRDYISIKIITHLLKKK